ncbi:twin-arginine translocase TatA/TatE family subunit [Actinoalloteichus hymeniacidonis]|uniref:Sec-independent protein translocase protein TatA n=1 Tax=Actinoalloteichus hymeniacidonis TaxID=340345 RepID=A0AAC9HPM7_9PSEU|nr:twin-arginine translocase TatA/TatE family subunit [Actinoalloteichus hymeniacidonis]AOS62255.1 Sec-independent protein secretion pathway component [Actinoalloteichus hymeniacidonis]MBB5909719.1 sec-independent protein translocase protein TatA [Actinoalloteichus hymeniacidonis]
MFGLGATELLIIAGVLVLLFGATKLPQMARSLGQSARILKAETKGFRGDKGETPAVEAAGSEAPGVQAAQVQQPVQTAPSAPVDKS